MKIIKIISKNKKTKKNNIGGYKSRIGYGECVVEEDGELVTKHCVELPK